MCVWCWFSICTYMEVNAGYQLSSIALHFIALRQGLLLNRDSLVRLSWLARGLSGSMSLPLDAGLQACTAMSDFFTWLVWLQTWLLVLREHRYPQNHILSPVCIFFGCTHLLFQFSFLQLFSCATRSNKTCQSLMSRTSTPLY